MFLKYMHINNSFSKDFEFQAGIWDKIKNFASSSKEITPSSVIGLLVKDPRLVLPKKKAFNKVEADMNKNTCLSQTNELDSGINIYILEKNKKFNFCSKLILIFLK